VSEAIDTFSVLVGGFFLVQLFVFGPIALVLP
jgi:hypothetical protein